jgi:hypothetical protein
MVCRASRAAAFPRKFPKRLEGGTEVEKEESKPSCSVVNFPSVIPSLYPAYYQLFSFRRVKRFELEERGHTSEYLDAILSYSTFVNGSVAPP